MKLPWLTFAAAGLINLAVLRAQDPTGIEITSEGAESVTQGTDVTTTFHGNVVLIDGGLRVTGDFLEVLADSQRSGPKASDQPASFKSMRVTGNVHIYHGTYLATCGRAEISQNEEEIVLSENPILRDTQTNSSSAPGPHGKINYYPHEHRVESVPEPGERTRTVLPTVKTLNLIPGAKPPTPPAPAPAK